MSAVLAAVADVSNPVSAAEELQRLNDLLARESSISPEVREGVHQFAAGVTQTALARWEALDPRHALLVLHSAVEAQEALEDPGGRDRLRVALETARQAFAAVAEAEPVADERTPKEVVRWLVEITEAPQARLAELLGVSLRHFQRWASPHESSHPEGDDVRTVRALARVVNQLRYVLTPAGVVDWFDWPRRDLRGATPRDALRDPARLPELLAAAASMRSTYAT
jgi:hypothetical protein